MKKKMLITTAAVWMAIATPSLYAQEATTIETVVDTVVSHDKYRVETNHFWDNWNLSVGAGPQIYFGDHNKQARFGDRISPALDISVGKWFSPSIGLRLMYSGLSVKGATQGHYHTNGKPIAGKPWEGYWLMEQKFDFYNLHADAVLNLHDIIAGYRPDRLWNSNVYFGVGWAHVWEKPHANEVTLNAGWLNTFRINKHFDINVEVRGTMVNDRFSGDIGGRYEEGILSLTAGITYWISSGWERSKTIYRNRHTTIDISDLNNRINDMTAENKRLRQALANGSKTGIRNIIKNIAGSIFIAFPINKSVVSNETRVNLSLFAELIRHGDPNEVYVITGYADKATGNAAINERLSRERAQAVYDCLINEFDVNPKQLRIDYKGGVENMFYNDPRLSRATIIRVEE